MTVTTIYANNDGYLYRGSVDEAWATIIAGAGTVVHNGSETYQFMWAGLGCSTTSNKFARSTRAIITFNTSTLPDGDTIIEATMSPYGEGADNYTNMAGTAPTLVVTGGTPADPTTFVAGDFEDAASTLLSDTAGVLSEWISTAEYKAFLLNSAGRNYISKTGYTVFYMRLNWDQSGTFGGTWGSGQDVYFAFTSTVYTGTTQDPKLVITHEQAPLTGNGLGSGNCMIF